MPVDAVVRARMGSLRLPGKTLLRAAGKTMLEHTLERIARSRRIDRIVVATTEDPEDDAIETVCRSIGVPCFRGSREDVLGRVHAAAVTHELDHVAHFGADNPLIDPAVCDEVAGVYEKGEWDYVTNNFPPTFPDGEEVEVTPTALLELAVRETIDPRHREHLLSWVWDNPARFRIRNVVHEPNLNHERWTLDTEEDWRLIEHVFETLYPRNPAFGMAEILHLLAARA